MEKVNLVQAILRAVRDGADAEVRQLLHDPRLSPLYAAAKLPPSHVVVGSADPLVAQAEQQIHRKNPP